MNIFVVILVAVVVQFVFAVISGEMAQGRKRDPAIWFLIGVVFGPVALIALAMFGKLPQTR